VALELHISRRAAREIERVVEWWADNRPAAPGAVRQDLEAAFGLLLVQPDIGSRVHQASSLDVRRFHVDRIRYWVYYRVRRDRLEVVSIWHASRGSGPTL
jgi:plasmid stabilization system protein ParE